MKKHLFLALALCIGLTSFAAPWDLKSKPKVQIVNIVNKEAWTNPFKAFDTYVTGCWSFEISPNYQPNHVCRLQVEFNQSVPEPYYVVVSVLGDWSTAPGYATERLFTILFPTGSWRKIVNEPMSSVEEIYPENTYAADYGPQ